MRFVAGILITLLFATGCRVDPRIAEPLPSFKPEEKIPRGWPLPVYRFNENPLSQEKFELGRELFYEEKLSVNNSISCASCHMQESAFAHTDHRLSHGVSELETRRNSPGIFNLTWHPSLMHDGGVNNIEVQPIAPIENPVEMGEDLENVIKKLQDDKKYRELFRKSFGSEEINSQRMLKALAQFMAMMYSYNSEYDRYKRGEVQLNAQELRGMDLFNQKCASCHSGPLFSDFEYRNNGLIPNQHAPDSGRAVITGNPADVYKFKTPSLRNVVLTYPYMHDGRYASLEECLDHYTSKIENRTNLDPLLENGIPMTQEEKKDIIAFLQTLTDYEFVRDRRFADPQSR